MRIHNPWNRSRAFTSLMSAVCFILCFCMTTAHAQSTPSYGIRYTMDIWTGADQQSIAVLMPRSARLSGKDKQAVLKGLFNQMKRTAAAKYGTASIAFKDGPSPASPEVFIWLDEAKSDRHNEVIAEVVYTFSEQGINAVSFPKFKMQPVSRSEIGYAAFNLTLPVWQTIGLDSKYIWTQLPSGKRITAQDFNQRLAKLDSEVIDAAWNQLQLSDEAALKVLEVAIANRFPKRMKRCLSSMESAEAKLRVLGARCAANLDARHVKAVLSILSETLLEDPDDSVRDQVQGILRASPHTALKQVALMRDLSSIDTSTVMKSIELVKPIKSEAVTQALKGLLAHKTDSIRKHARACLLDRKSAQTLAEVVNDENTPVAIRQETALGMMTAKDVKAQAMFYLAGAGTTEQWASVAKELSSMPDKIQISTLEAALGNQDQIVVVDSLERFASLDGKAALEPLLKFNAVAALKTQHLSTITSICSRLSDKVLLATSKSKDLRLKKCTIKTLASKSNTGKSALKRRLIPVLKKLAKDKNSELRALAIEGLGDMNEKSTHSLLLKAIEDTDHSVVAAAAGGLRHVANVEPILIKLSTHTSPAVIGEVFRAMGVQGFASAVPLILQSAARSELEIRLSGTRALGQLSGKIENQKAAFDFYSVRLNDSHPDVRTVALIGLSQNQDPRHVQAMASLAQDSHVDVQITAIELLGKTGNPQAVEGASSGLAHSNVRVRGEAIKALKKLGGPEASSILKRHTQQETDPALLKMLK